MAIRAYCLRAFGSVRQIAPTIRKVDELECRRNEIAAEIERADGEQATRDALRDISARSIHTMLDGLADEVIDQENRGRKSIIQSVIERVVLDPTALSGRIHYRIRPEKWLSMASPRKFGSGRARQVYLGGFRAPVPPETRRSGALFLP